MKVRPYADADLEAVADVFTSAVHILAVAEYTKEQREAWAPKPPDLERLRKRLQHLQTLVAVESNDIAGFIAFEPNGHIDFTYVSPPYARRGVASMLYSHVEATLVSAGVTELFTEASLVARPFFERVGFVVAEEQEVTLRGSSFRRFGMRKSPGAAQRGVPANR